MAFARVALARLPFRLGAAMLQGLGAFRHLVVLWVFVLSVDAYVVATLWTSRQEAQRQAAQLATSYVRLVEEQASGSFGRADLMLRHVAASLTPSELRAGLRLSEPRHREVEAIMADLQRDGHGVVSMSVTDAQGRVVLNSLGLVSGNSLGDRAYFRALSEGRGDGPVVSEMVRGRVSNKWGIQVARALRVDGRFAGMVVANMGLSEFFVPFYQSMLLPSLSAVSLRDAQHRVVVRYPVVDAAKDQPLAIPTPNDQSIDSMGEGTYRRPSPVDGIERVVAFRKLPDYPLYAVVALADKDTLASWRSAFDLALVFLLLTTLAAGLATIVLRRQERLQAQVLDNADKLAVALRAAHAATWHWEAATDRLEWKGDVATLYRVMPPATSLTEWIAALPPEERSRVRDEVERVLRVRDTEYRQEFRVPDGQGGWLWLAGIGRVTYDAEGHALDGFGVNIDVTAVKKAEIDLKAAHAAALEAKNEAERASLSRSKFLAAASHDLRQPVQSLLLLIEVMKLRLAGTAMEAVTVQMENALDGLRLLLNSLLDMSKLDAGIIVPVMEPVDLGHLLARLADEYRVRAAERDLELRVVPTSRRLITDPALLERLLRNLLENALRYTPSGKVLLGCRSHGPDVQVVVADTGIGIAPEHQDVVFEEFHQVANAARDRNQGLGLGLAIVRRLAHLLGGEVSLVSALGHGCRFSVILPQGRGANSAMTLSDGCGILTKVNGWGERDDGS